MTPIKCATSSRSPAILAVISVHRRRDSDSSVRIFVNSRSFFTIALENDFNFFSSSLILLNTALSSSSISAKRDPLLSSFAADDDRNFAAAGDNNYNRIKTRARERRVNDEIRTQKLTVEPPELV